MKGVKIINFMKSSWIFCFSILSISLCLDTMIFHIPIFNMMCSGIVFQISQINWNNGARIQSLTFLMSCILSLSISGVHCSNLEAQESGVGFVLGQAVQAYLWDNGNMPDQLNDLVPNYLEKIPPVQSPITGQFQYKKGNFSASVNWGILRKNTVVILENAPNHERAGLTYFSSSQYDQYPFSSIEGEVVRCDNGDKIENVHVIGICKNINQVETWTTTATGAFYFPQITTFLFNLNKLKTKELIQISFSKKGFSRHVQIFDEIPKKIIKICLNPTPPLEEELQRGATAQRNRLSNTK